MRAYDITGLKFGLLTAIKRAKPFRGYTQAVWLCKCDCGKYHKLFGYLLWHGKVRSCGCLKKEGFHWTHRMSHYPEYKTWHSIRNRCNNSRCKAYPHYGGRGITICESWNDFAVFIADMGRRPPGMTLDRINNDGNYEKKNCRWVTVKQQVRNRRTTTFCVINKVSRPLQEWGELYGITYMALWYRYKNGDRGAHLLRPLRTVK